MADGVIQQRVWDWTIRLFHWSLVVSIPALWFTAENGWMDWHTRIGVITCGLLVFRIYWGFAGPETARFAQFLKGPRAVAAYLARLRGPSYRPAFGHSPLGALSVMALLLALTVQLVSGLLTEDVDGLSSGPLARFVDYETGLAAGEFHETSFNFVLALVALHIVAILFYLLVLKTNLIGAMVTGLRQVEDGQETKGADNDVRAQPVRVVVGVVLAAGVVIGLLQI